MAIVRTPLPRRLHPALSGGKPCQYEQIEKVFKIERFRGQVLSHSALMKRKELTPKQLVSVPCPTCGAAAGKRCVLYSGALRSEPHVDRMFAAIEAIEKK